MGKVREMGKVRKMGKVREIGKMAKVLSHQLVILLPPGGGEVGKPAAFPEEVDLQHGNHGHD